jgi:hypothetical protein
MVILPTNTGPSATHSIRGSLPVSESFLNCVGVSTCNSFWIDFLFLCQNVLPNVSELLNMIKDHEWKLNEFPSFEQMNWNACAALLSLVLTRLYSGILLSFSIKFHLYIISRRYAKGNGHLKNVFFFSFELNQVCVKVYCATVFSLYDPVFVGSSTIIEGESLICNNYILKMFAWE